MDTKVEVEVEMTDNYTINGKREGAATTAAAAAATTYDYVSFPSSTQTHTFTCQFPYLYPPPPPHIQTIPYSRYIDYEQYRHCETTNIMVLSTIRAMGMILATYFDVYGNGHGKQ